MPNRHIKRAARRAASETGDGGRMGTGFAQFVRARPLLVVAAGIGLGMTLGALLPWKLMEDELLGEQAEKLKDGALELVSDGYGKAKSVAQRGYDAAAEILRGGEGATASNEVESSIAPESGTSTTDRYRN